MQIAIIPISLTVISTFNLVKRIVYSEKFEKFNDSVNAMKQNDIYRKYANFKKHVEENILPRHKEWSLKERLVNRLPTHNQNTTNIHSE